MNRHRYSLLLWFLITAMAMFHPDLSARSAKGTLTDSAIQHHRFVFYAHWAVSYNGVRRQLTPPYELLVTSDSIACFLPYTGRMYTVPTPEELRFMSIRFTSKKFSYRKQERRHSGWDVVIRPADVRDVQELFFSIPRKGWTTLTIRSAGRDPMSYEGYVGPLPK